MGTMENQGGLINECPLDGCVVLGRKGPAYNVYNTRFYVDRKERRAKVTQDILLDSCFPCCKRSNQKAFCKALWSVIRSESFLFLLQMIVLCIGVTKECLYLRSIDRLLHLYQSVIELFLATTHMSIRMGAVWLNFRKMTFTIKDVEHIEEEMSVRGKTLRKVIVCYIGTGIVLIVANFIFFIVFQHIAHLGWTLLTNNAFMVAVSTVAYILNEKLLFLKCQMREDDCRITLSETTLLLRETFMLKDTESRTNFLARVERFVAAYNNTPYFSLPEYIHVIKEHIPDWNIYSSAEHITVV